MADTDDPEGEVTDNERLLPIGVQIPFATILAIVIGWSMWRLVSYAKSNPKASPSDLRLHETILVAGVLLLLLLLPWHRLGLVVKKVGWVEFERVVSVQKKENVESLVALENRLAALERACATSLAAGTGGSLGGAGTIGRPTPVQNGTANRTLRDLLLNFLRQYPRWYFNAARIRLWGAKQPGFTDLAQYPKVLIAQELQRLLDEDAVIHRISSSGSTQYRARPSPNDD